MKPNQIKILKKTLMIILIILIGWFIIKHIIGALIILGIIIIIAGVMVKFAPKVLELFDNVKDFFSK